VTHEHAVDRCAAGGCEAIDRYGSAGHDVGFGVAVAVAVAEGDSHRALRVVCRDDRGAAEVVDRRLPASAFGHAVFLARPLNSAAIVPTRIEPV